MLSMKFFKYLIPIIIIAIVCLFVCMCNYIYDDKDACLDSGYCKEGLSLNTANGQIIINEENCKQENGTWIDKKRVCQLK